MPRDVRSRGGEGNRIGCFSKKFFCLDFDDPREGGDNDHAVVGFALRFALNARPTGSQGFAPGKPTTKTRTNAKSKKKSKTKTTTEPTQKGTFLKSFDIPREIRLTNRNLPVYPGSQYLAATPGMIVAGYAKIPDDHPAPHNSKSHQNACAKMCRERGRLSSRKASTSTQAPGTPGQRK